MQLVSRPLELAGLREDCAAFFMDAHVAWLDWTDLQRPLKLAPDAHFIVHHSADLSPKQSLAMAVHAQLYPGDITAELVTGMQLGMGAWTPPRHRAQPAPLTCRAPAGLETGTKGLMIGTRKG